MAGGLCRHVAGRAAVCAVGPLECPLDVRVGTAWARARRPRLGSPDPVWLRGGTFTGEEQHIGEAWGAGPSVGVPV